MPDSVRPDFNAPQPPGRSTAARPRPWPVWVIFLILFIQGLAVLVSTVADLVVSGTHRLDAAGTAALLTLYLLCGAVLIVLGSRIFIGASGARTPSMLLQLMMVVLSFNLFSGGLIAVALLFLLPAALALLLLFSPPTTAWLEAPEPPAET